MESKPVLRVAGVVLAALWSLTACTSSGGARPALPAAGPTSGPTITDQPAATPDAGRTPEASTARAPTQAPPATPEGPVPAAERLRQAIRQQEEGEYEAASAAFQALIESDPGAEVARDALLRLGYCDLQAGAYEAAARGLQRLVAAYPGDPEARLAYFWLGQAQAARGDGQGAAAAYRSYLERNPLLGRYVQELTGDALAKAGDHVGAIEAYRTALDSETATVNRVRMLESLAGSQRALGRYDEALSACDEILKVARNAGYRAQIMHEAGAVLREAGQTAAAAARWNELVATYPETSYAAQALPLLDEWRLARVDALTRARVEYGAGDYTAALATLRRYLHDEPQSHAGDAHYYAALCYRELGQHSDSLREFDWLISTHPQNALVPEAWYERGESLTMLGAVDDAAAAFQQLAANYPQHARGVQALWRAAQVYDQAGRSWDASAAYARAAATYPGASYASNARFRAGLTHYLNRAVQTAATTWANLLPQETEPAMRARLLLWLGKAAQRLGDEAGAREWWAQAVAADPGGFWGLRARDLAAGQRFGGQAPAGGFDPALYAPRGQQSEAEAWLASWAGPPDEGQPAGELPPSLSDLESFRRSAELWQLGQADAAAAEMRQVVASLNDDPWALYALALYCRDQGLFLFSTSIAERILALAPAEVHQKSPRYFEELAYPTNYADLVLREAQPTNTDPLLFFALIRQESYFDRDATSRSDARGLTQVIPSTGEYIAGQLGVGSYSPEQLWRPGVSVRYGMWYLASALRMFDDNALLALVAYNAGPGNATRWSRLSDGDDDLFFEQVGSLEPRSYMRRIYEHRAHYEKLYR